MTRVVPTFPFGIIIKVQSPLRITPEVGQDQALYGLSGSFGNLVQKIRDGRSSWKIHQQDMVVELDPAAVGITVLIGKAGNMNPSSQFLSMGEHLLTSLRT